MKINGIMLALLDIPAEHTEDYNRWYDLDHLAEHVSKGDVVMGRRYVATRQLRAAPGVLRSESTGGYPPYATIYSFGGPIDFMSDEAFGLWREMDRGIVKAGRYWREGSGRYAQRWRLADARARPSVLVAKEAVPHLAHRGVIVTLGRAPSVDRVDESVGWWDETHLVDLFAVPGLLGAMRFTPVDPANGELLLHILLCEDPPGDVMAGIDKAMRYQRAVGRYPAHGGIYEPIAFLPYERIVPLEYNFDISEEDR
jgi:hypothetical protein